MWLPIKQKTVREQLLHQYLCVPAVPSHGSRTHLAKTGNPSPTPAHHADPSRSLAANSDTATPTAGSALHMEQCGVVLQKESTVCMK